jgi:hypothetical protein
MVEGMRSKLSQMSADDPERRVAEDSVAALESQQFTEFTTHETTTWHSTLDQEIDPKVFEFSPPDS